MADLVKGPSDSSLQYTAPTSDEIKTGFWHPEFDTKKRKISWQQTSRQNNGNVDATIKTIKDLLSIYPDIVSSEDLRSMKHLLNHVEYRATEKINKNTWLKLMRSFKQKRLQKKILEASTQINEQLKKKLYDSIPANPQTQYHRDCISIAQNTCSQKPKNEAEMTTLFELAESKITLLKELSKDETNPEIYHFPLISGANTVQEVEDIRTLFNQKKEALAKIKSFGDVFPLPKTEPVYSHITEGASVPTESIDKSNLGPLLEQIKHKAWEYFISNQKNSLQFASSQKAIPTISEDIEAFKKSLESLTVDNAPLDQIQDLQEISRELSNPDARIKQGALDKLKKISAALPKPTS